MSSRVTGRFTEKKTNRKRRHNRWRGGGCEQEKAKRMKAKYNDNIYYNANNNSSNIDNRINSQDNVNDGNNDKNIKSNDDNNGSDDDNSREKGDG